MRARGIVAALVVAVALPAGAAGYDRKGFRDDVIWLTAAGAADLAATRYALGACDVCYEGNPLARRHLVLTKILGTAVIVGGLRLLRERGHDRMATVIRWAIVGVWAVVSAWNVYLADRGPL